MNKNKKIAIIMWCLTALCMIVIFYFSSQPADQSMLQSGAILLWFQNHFGDGAITDFAVRKSAHFSEYAGLGFLLGWSWLFTKGKRLPVISVICASVYSISDEVHQIFVEGRSCQIFDWALDTLGAITGVLVFMLLCAIWRDVKNIRILKNTN